MIVVDTNIIAYFILKSEHTGVAEQVYAKDSVWIAPILWRSKFRNLLAGYLRRALLDLDGANQFSLKAMRLMSGNEYLPRSKDVLSLVSHSNCSAYDCEFVALGRERGVPLVTADRRILGEFPDTAVSMDSFLTN